MKYHAHVQARCCWSMEHSICARLCQILLTVFFIICQGPLTQEAVAQERPDTLKLSQQDLEVRSFSFDSHDLSAEVVAEESDDQPVARSAQIETYRRRRFPKRARRLRRVLGRKGARYPFGYPQIDGTANNRSNIEWGKANIPFTRLAPASYTDGTSVPVTEGKMPGARQVSNSCFDQTDHIPNKHRVTDFLWQWGQFLDHDITLTPVSDPEELYMISIPQKDLFFDPNGSGAKQMKLERSAYTMVNGVREQMNNITAFIDASNVYGSDQERANALRTLDGTGELKEGEGRLLPFNTEELPNAQSHGRDPGDFFLAGDFRANEQVGLTSMHVLFVREHNYWAKYLRRAFRGADGDRIYQMARGIVTAEMQAITYNEFLPALLGDDALPPYRGYQEDVDPRISNEFATAAYRFGHSMLSSFLPRIDKNGQTIAAGHLLLRDAFFQPKRLVTEGGVDPVLRGLASRRAQEIDNKLIDDVRNFLFGPPGAGGFDLASLNIQRARDHGLPSYNTIREALGLRRMNSFEEISTDPAVVSCLRSSYQSVDDIDLWVGGLSEDHERKSMMGQTFTTILTDQFTRLRDGDRFWYQHHLPRKLRKLVSRQTLSKIIRRNTGIGAELQDDVFHTSRF